MNEVYIGLGSNLGERETFLKDAIKLLRENKEIKLEKQSSIYETAPVGYKEQGHFLNMVIKVKTSLSHLQLLDVCQKIEDELGRERTTKNGPRTIDLDILLYNKENRDLGRLRIPHPRLHERAFVLVPLHEIAPDLIMPTSGKHIEDLINDISSKELAEVIKWQEK